MTIFDHVAFGPHHSTFTFFSAKELALLIDPSVTSVHGFPMDGQQVLFTKNPRGIDIIGGHVESGETPEAALMRECMEEGALTAHSFMLIGGIAIDNKNNPTALAKGYPEIGYQFFYLIDQFTLHPFVATHECTDRVWVPKYEVAQQHHQWLSVHQALLEACIDRRPRRLRITN